MTIQNVTSFESRPTTRAMQTMQTTEAMQQLPILAYNGRLMVPLTRFKARKFDMFGVLNLDESECGPMLTTIERTFLETAEDTGRRLSLAEIMPAYRQAYELMNRPELPLLYRALLTACEESGFVYADN